MTDELFPDGGTSEEMFPPEPPADPPKRPQAKKVAAPKPPININVGSGDRKTAGKSKLEGELDAVQKRAETVLSWVAVGLQMADAPSQDILDILAHKDTWAESVRNVAEYEPWLRDLCQGGEISGRVMAWVGLAVSTGTIALPILLRHDALPEVISAKLGRLAGMVETGNAPSK